MNDITKKAEQILEQKNNHFYHIRKCLDANICPECGEEFKDINKGENPNYTPKINRYLSSNGFLGIGKKTIYYEKHELDPKYVYIIVTECKNGHIKPEYPKTKEEIWEEVLDQMDDDCAHLMF
jgi:hypothetical protein